MLCIHCKLHSVSPHEVEHCDACADYLRSQGDIISKAEDKSHPRVKRLIYRVRIEKCSSPDLYWYNDKIGEVFDCELYENDSTVWPCQFIFRTIDFVKTAKFAPNLVKRGNILPQDALILKEYFD